MSERRTDVVDPDAEREVDLRSAWSRIAARWWLPVGGLVVGAILGVLVSLGSAQVYEAETLIAMGQPFSPNGGAPVASFLTNGRAVAEIIRSESALEKAGKASGLRTRALRGNVTSQIVGASGPGARPTGAPLVTIKVIALTVFIVLALPEVNNANFHPFLPGGWGSPLGGVGWAAGIG